jgi:pimeloyl-[acyl-carrier protein] methyl ester esterase
MSATLPLVLLPGWSLPAALFDGLRRSLPADGDARVLAYGVSDAESRQAATVTHDPAAAASALLAGMARNALAQSPARALWCGHSLGGLVALQAALLARERVAGLLLLATTPCFVARTDWPCALPAAELAAFAAGLATDPDATLARFDALQCRGGDSVRADLRAVRAWRADAASLNQPAGTDFPWRPNALRLGLDVLASADLRTSLAKVTCPQTWLFGAKDALVPAAVAREIRLLAPSARVVTCAAANHLPGLANDAQALRDALAGLRAAVTDAGTDAGTQPAPITEPR